MDGLECKEINIKEVDKKLFRIEPEYFQKKYLIAEQILSKYDLFNASKIECGPFGSNLLDTNYQSDGVLVVRPFNLISGTIENDRLVYVNEKLIQENNLKTYGKGCVLFSRVGDIKIGYSNKSFYTISPNIVIADVKDDSIAKYYSIFFNTFYGKIQIQRQLKVSAQPTISTEIISKLRVPFFVDLFNYVVLCVNKAEENIETARKIYEFEENKLSLIISAKAEAPSNISIKNISASFVASGRLDAEYYQPKYESIAKILNTRETVLSLCNLYDKNFNPDEKQTYQYIELADVGRSGDIFDVDIQYGSDLPTRARRIVKSGQIIVSSVEGSLQSCALITDEYDGALCSTGFYVLDSDVINSETLVVLFKSEPIQALMKQRCSGTILTAISKDELLSMPIPMIDENVQKEIAAKVQESFALRKQSKQLLEYAKQAVEKAIEQGEDVALEWLKNKIPTEV